MKKITISCLIIVFITTFIECNNSKKEVVTSLINRFSRANQEEDKNEIAELFPGIAVFHRYPKADKIIINEINIENEHIAASCSLYYETPLGKNIEKEVMYYVNTKDTTIEDVLGYLTLDERKEIQNRWYLELFNDLKPSSNDFDCALVKKDQVGLKRITSYEYHAMKAIGDLSKAEVLITNSTLNIKITNNSSFVCEYEYKDDNNTYTYSFSNLTEFKKDKIMGVEGRFKLKAGETIILNTNAQTIFHEPLKKDRISIKPSFDALDFQKNKQICEKYYSSDKIEEMNKGERDYILDCVEYQIAL